jgi:NAD(P)-dependent dehydrogenase (short-subunit alcohol dehydrogenase family)
MVMIGIDPHKRNHTAVAVSRSEDVLGQRLVHAGRTQVAELVAWADSLDDVQRTWAIESAGGLGYLLAQQLLAAGERVVDIPAVFSASGRIDIVVNNAGVAGGGGSVAAPVASEIDALMAVHFTGTLATMSAAFPHMTAQRWGRVVNTVSEVALDSRYAGSLGYSVAKAAVWSATLVAAREGAGSGITVNAISPAARTRMNADLLDAGFRDGASAALDLDPAHVARVAAFLVSEEAAHVTGRIVHVAGPAVREYTTSRSSRTELVERIVHWLADSVTPAVAPAEG